MRQPFGHHFGRHARDDHVLELDFQVLDAVAFAVGAQEIDGDLIERGAARGVLVQQRADDIQILREDHFAMFGAFGGMATRGRRRSGTRLDDLVTPRADFDPIRVVLVLRFALERRIAELDVDVLHCCKPL
ncbi:hypothetical protein D3C73_1328160 [compost metagenome]